MGEACKDLAWSTPRPIGGGRVARFANIVGNHDEAYVVGSNIRGPTQPTIAGDLLTLLTFDGIALEPPRGQFLFAFPRAAVDSARLLHLLWAEPPTPIPSGEPVPLFGMIGGSVWAATYSLLNGWSEAMKIHDGPVFWMAALNDEISRDGAELAITTATHGAFVLLRFDGTQWVSSQSSWQGVGLNVSTAMHRGTIYNAHLGIQSESERGVFFRVSSDKGTTWSSKVLHRSVGPAPQDVRIRAASDGALHVIWVETLSRPVVRHIRSSDGGASWSAPQDLELPETYGAPQASLDRCGRLHVVFDHYSSDHGHVDAATWDDNWTSVRHLSQDAVTLGSSLGVLSDGRVVLATLARPLGSSVNSPLTTQVSEARP